MNLKFKNNKTKWLDLWTKQVLGLSPREELTRKIIEDYQLKRLNDLFDYARQNGNFYNRLYRDLPNNFHFKKITDIQKLPLTGSDDLRKYGDDFLCVNPKEISRIITLETSGTTGKPKHICFTPEDQDLSIAHFRYGMQYLIDSDGKVLILLPHTRPGSVGDLLGTAVKNLGAEFTYDFNKSGITCIVGLPTQLASLAKGHPERANEFRKTVNTVLLTAEYVSQESIKTITDIWDCMPFEHYGMTEMGLGGAVTCNCLNGYHPREHDLLFEIIDPDTGKNVPDGEYGEVVFTTLTRRGMPFIRYRTNDFSKFMPEPCPCESVLKRLSRVGMRNLKKGYA